MDDIAKPAPIPDAADLQARLDRLERLKAARPTPEGLRKAATELEAVFTRQVVQMMFKGVDEDNLFGGGQGGRMFREFLYDEYAKIMAERGTLGVGDMVYDQMMQRYGAEFAEPPSAQADGPDASLDAGDEPPRSDR